MSPIFKLTILIIVIGTSITSCATFSNYQGRNPMVAKTIEQVLREHTKELMSVPGVVGTAQGLCDQKPCIKVYVIKKTPELDQKIPNILEGYPVMVEETGEIRALPKN
jgi:sulfite exporter TauE/SafE